MPGCSFVNKQASAQYGKHKIVKIKSVLPLQFFDRRVAISKV
jgi:hypothetical protein